MAAAREPALEGQALGHSRGAAGAGGVELEPPVWPRGRRDRRLHRVGRRPPAKGLRVEAARLLMPHHAREAAEQPPSDAKRLVQIWNPPGTSRFQGRREERRR